MSLNTVQTAAALRRDTARAAEPLWPRGGSRCPGAGSPQKVLKMRDEDKKAVRLISLHLNTL